jgi:glutathione S-transferase
VTNRLITIGASHYCEKARWALEHAGIPFVEEMHPPILHTLATYRNGGKRTVPVLITEEGTYSDSTDILELADRHVKGALYGVGSEARRETKELEDLYDRRLGPHTRRIVYFHLLDTPAFPEVFDFGLSRGQRIAFRVLRPGVRGLIRRGLGVTEKGAEKSRSRIHEVFDGVAKRLGDGRRYLMGERFGAADLTFAALAAPMLMPPSYGYPLPTSGIPSSLTREVDELRATTAGKFALRIYAEDRDSSPSDTL